MKRVVRISLACALALLLAGCSSTTFLYNRLGFILPWYVGKYVHLDREQKNLLDAELEPFLEWHRREELPAYLDWLGRAGSELDGQLTPERLAALAAEAEDAWLRIERRSLEWMITLGESLRDEQVAEFVASLREEQADWSEEDLSRDDEAYREDVADNMRDRLEDYLGRLDAAQLGILAAAAANVQRADGVWLGERARWLDRLEQILAREPGWQDDLRQAIAAREAFNSPEYHAVFDHNAGVIYAALADVLNSRSERQDRRLRGKLRDLREDLESLIGQ